MTDVPSDVAAASEIRERDASAGIAGRGFAGWRMAVIAFLAQNTAIGMNFGLYGTLVVALQTEYSTSRALAASGLSAMTLVMGLLSPLVGSLTHKVSLRTLMLAGALLGAAGYGLMMLVHSIYAVLAVYALVIGPGVCLLGVIPSSALVSNWFIRGRGRALGFVNTPFFVFVFPFLGGTLLKAYGTGAVFLTAAGVFLCLLPILAFVVPHPARIGQKPLGDLADLPGGVAGNRGAPPMSSLEILRNPAFLVLTLGIGILTAGGLMMVTHLVPLALDRGIGLASASLLLSAFGIAGAAGSLVFGWVADRIGGPMALTIQSLAWTLPWTALLFAGDDYPALFLLAVLMGLCSGGIVGLCGVVMNQWLGPQNFGRAMGCCYLLKVPFLFGAAPLAGFMFDRTGGYTASILLHIASFVGVGLMFLFYRPRPMAV